MILIKTLRIFMMKQKYTILITKKRVGLLQRSYSRFKEFSLGCLVVARNGHSLSIVVIRCHSLSFVVPLVVIRCHSLSLFSFVVNRWTTRCHWLYYSLSFVVIYCTTRCHSLSFVFTCSTTRCQSTYHLSIFLKTIYCKLFYTLAIDF